MERVNVNAHKAVEISAVRTMRMNTHLEWLFSGKMSFHRYCDRTSCNQRDGGATAKNGKSIVTIFLITLLAASSHVADRKRQEVP